MAHHRCTRCKQESYPRHKYFGGVFCDDCIKWIRGFRLGRGRGFLGSLWDRFTAWIGDLFRPESKPDIPARQVEERRIHAEMKTMEKKARKIQANPALFW